MTIDDALAVLAAPINAASPAAAVVRVTRGLDTEAAIHAHAPGDSVAAISEPTREVTPGLLTNDGLAVRMLVYDIATSFPPDET